jgi:hypothetical protein
MLGPAARRQLTIGLPEVTIVRRAQRLKVSANCRTDLFARIAPHLTVLTDDGDPDISAHDPVVARALTDAAGVADASGAAQQTADC